MVLMMQEKQFAERRADRMKMRLILVQLYGSSQTAGLAKNQVHQ